MDRLQNAAFLRRALPMLEALPYVERYAWFELKWTASPWEHSALVSPRSGIPTDVGVAYRDATRGKSRAGRAGNPVFEGWYADPEGAVFGSDYWIFPTYSAPYDQQVFLDAFSSPDLVTWTKHSRIMDTNAIRWAKRALWAPAIIQKDKKYYLFFGANDIQNDQQPGGIGVAVANHPAGPFKDHLGKPLIDKFHNGAQPIDQFVFQDRDGSYYLIYGGWRHCNITRLRDDFTGFLPFPDQSVFKEITPQGYVEGPFMFWRGGKYYFMWSEGGWTGPNYSVAYAMADSPLGPFQRIGKILQQDATIATGAGHHSVIHNALADAWYIVYHRRPLGVKDGNYRITCIDRMEFDAQGLIKPVQMTHEGLPPQKLR
jgi:beta-xylosidase